MVRVSKWKRASIHARSTRLMVTEFWLNPKRGVSGVCVDPGNDHKNTRRVGRREVVYLPLNKPESLNLRTRPRFFASFFEAEGMRDMA